MVYLNKFSSIKFDDDIFSNDPQWIIDYDKNKYKQKLTKHFLEKFKNILNWTILCRTQKLDINFVKDNVDILPINMLLKFQNLNSDFLRFLIKNYNQDINWNLIVKHQSLDFLFIKDYISYLNIRMLIDYQNLNNSIKKFINDFIYERLIELDISNEKESEEFEELLYIYV